MEVVLQFINNRHKMVFWNTIDNKDVREAFDLIKVERDNNHGVAFYHLDIPPKTQLFKITLNSKRRLTRIDRYEIDHNGFPKFIERVK